VSLIKSQSTSTNTIDFNKSISTLPLICKKKNNALYNNALTVVYEARHPGLVKSTNVKIIKMLKVI